MELSVRNFPKREGESVVRKYYTTLKRNGWLRLGPCWWVTATWTSPEINSTQEQHSGTAVLLLAQREYFTAAHVWTFLIFTVELLPQNKALCLNEEDVSRFVTESVLSVRAAFAHISPTGNSCLRIRLKRNRFVLLVPLGQLVRKSSRGQGWSQRLDLHNRHRERRRELTTSVWLSSLIFALQIRTRSGQAVLFSCWLVFILSLDKRGRNTTICFYFKVEKHFITLLEMNRCFRLPHHMFMRKWLHGE